MIDIVQKFPNFKSLQMFSGKTDRNVFTFRDPIFI